MLNQPCKALFKENKKFWDQQQKPVQENEKTKINKNTVEDNEEKLYVVKLKQLY